MDFLLKLTKILPRKYQQLWIDYCIYLDFGWKHFFIKHNNKEINKEKLRLLEKALRRTIKMQKNALGRLQKEITQENISLSVLLEPLNAWRYMCDKQYMQNEQQLSDIINLIMSPSARLFMVLNNEIPSTYLPMSTYLNAYCWLFLRQTQPKLLNNIKFSKSKQYNKMLGLLHNSWILLSITKHKKLKFCMAREFNTLKFMLDKLKNNEQSKLNLLDHIKIFLYSCLQFLFIKYKSVAKRGL